MSYTAQAAQYREMQVMTASRERLVILIYDHLLVTLRRLRMAVEAGNVEARISLLDKARVVITELLIAVDRERGGEIAEQLISMYAFLLSALLDQGKAPDIEQLDRITGIVTEFRDAFAQIAGEEE